MLLNTLRTTSLIMIALLVSVFTTSGFSCTFNNQLHHRFQTESPGATRSCAGRTVSFRRFADQRRQFINISTVRMSLALHWYDQVVDHQLTCTYHT